LFPDEVQCGHASLWGSSFGVAVFFLFVVVFIVFIVVIALCVLFLFLFLFLFFFVAITYSWCQDWLGLDFALVTTTAVIREH
jgi:hypothetical protein